MLINHFRLTELMMSLALHVRIQGSYSSNCHLHHWYHPLLFDGLLGGKLLQYAFYLLQQQSAPLISVYFICLGVVM